ncbi:MAG: hypothetical protein PVS3B3_22030 [Ktedonobacteraceae bacterium]
MYRLVSLLTKQKIDIPLRITIAFLATFACVAFAFIFFNGVSHHTAKAATGALQELGAPGANPWGIAFDHNGNEWVAQPGCDPSPICSSVVQGSIAQVNRSSFSIVQNFQVPPSYSSPLFVATDASGNVWFTEPMTNAIGELIPSSGTWNQWIVPTASAAPFDLAFDANGNLWFTEVLANQIGEFSNGQFHETATPFGNSKPYGITGPDPSTGQMWFTENSTQAARIGGFAPPASGALTTGNIKEYLTINPGNSTTAHLITYDYQGNIWWTEGTNSRIGRLIISQAHPGASNGVAEYPTPCQTVGGCSAGSHISGISVDGGGTIWLDDSLADRIYSFNPNNNSFSAPIVLAANAHPHDGLTVDNNNTVYVSEEFANKFAEITQTGVPTPPSGGTNTPTSAPVSKTWYFAEGRVGKGFREYLTIDNPGTTSCAVDITYLYTADGNSTPQTKMVPNVTINPTSRFTESVNQDLASDAAFSSGKNVASIVNVNNSSNCTGVMVERPIYFVNYHGINSGTDVAGATHLGTSFSFADVASDASHISFLTILNPPGGANATVTATYYAGGNMVGKQIATVPAGERGTIVPGQITLPAHSLAVVTSTAPVMVERPTYFLHESQGISGAYDVVGTQISANDWFFAEGYTGAGTQENLTLANPNPIAATVNVILKSQVGVTKTFALMVGPQSQTIWNVNQNNTFHGTPEVSAEVRSSVNIIVQREMYFQYHHTATGAPTVYANGGTDSLGLIGPVARTYSFSEGYTNQGYNEWLTLQNPNATDEAITITLTNGSNQKTTLQQLVRANERQTVDITSAVVQAFNPRVDKNANAISMTVQSSGTFVAERPEYYNTLGSGFGVQGGTDIIGYIGN